ncbi:MAG: hypothetical protein ACOCRX_11700 [Candidatus Woesearchaeota archaeon]
MLDTIILKIPIETFSCITNPGKFNPSASTLRRKRGYAKCIKNPTAKDKREENYKPRLTLIKRGKEIYLKVEFSAPKLIFGNNINELRENDFDKIVDILQQKIKEMGVKLWKHQIEKAEIISFHPSKNIIIHNGYTTSFAIRELSKIDLNKKLDLEKTSFRNNGEALQFYCNRHSFVFYDKIKDLNKPPKRAIDKDQTKKQLEILDYIKQKNLNPEILRIEVRLSKRRKMKEVLDKVNFKNDITLENIFNSYLCKSILNMYWENFFSDNKFLFSVNNRPQAILQKLLAEHPDLKPSKAIKITGLTLLCRDEEGIRGFRSIAEKYNSNFNWSYIKKYLEKIETKTFVKSKYGFIKDIEEQLNSFKPIELKIKDI